MVTILNKVALVCLLGLFWLPGAFAQQTTTAKKQGDSSEEVEQREDSYRRQMELQDARAGEKVYIDTTYAKTAKSEKLNGLPEESRDNIRDQLVDVIVENGEWKPGDALREYPYQPTVAAEADPALKELEQAAWDEQIEKYHTREAAAFGAYRGRAPGPGNPDGPEGGQQGEGSQGQQGQQGGGQGGEGEEAENKKDSAGTYQPYQASSSSSENEVSTAGVSESALDFLTGGQAQSQPAGQSSQAQAQAQAQQNTEQAMAEQAANENAAESQSEDSAQDAEQLAEQNPEQEQSEQQSESSSNSQPDLRGIIAIKDLDKLEGTEILVEPEDPEDSEDP